MKCLIALGAMALLAKSVFATIITDPVGDASGHADVVVLSGVYNHTSLFLSAQFQPGTLDSTNLAFFIGLDTDQNPATGEQPFFPIGSEFVVGFNSLASTSQVTIFQQHVGLVGSVPISFGTNSFSVAVPLSMLGNDDGAALLGSPKEFLLMPVASMLSIMCRTARGVAAHWEGRHRRFHSTTLELRLCFSLSELQHSVSLT
jgi:hypothetical protein